MAKLSPFGKRGKTVEKRQEVVPVTIGESTAYVLRTGRMTLREYPTSMQQAERDEARITALQMEAIRNYASQEDITTEEARNRIIPKRDGDRITPGIAFNPGDYLTSSQMEELLFLNGTRHEVRLSAATIAVQTRILYPVTIESVEPAEDGIKLSVEIGGSTVFSNDSVFRSDDGSEFKVKELIRLDGLEFLAHKTTSPIAPGQVFFLCSEDGSFKRGFADWTIQDTESNMDIGEWEALAEFLMSEHPSRRAATMSGDEESASEEVGKLAKSGKRR